MSIAPPPTMTAPEPPDQAAYRAPQTDLIAMLAMLASVAGLTLLPVLGSIGGIVLGAIALGRTRAPDVGGRPLALWGLVLGIAGLVVLTLAGVLFAVGIGAAIASMPPIPGV